MTEDKSCNLAPAASRGVGLALSGGGMRAAAFHLGVLRCLATRGAMETVIRLSTVSGGSLITAAIMAQSGMKWPSSPQYLDATYPALRQLLTTRSLFSLDALGLVGIARHAFHLFNRRADILVDLLRRQWGISAMLSDLPETPVWWINATCTETGKNWRFSKREMGDWRFGRHYAPPYSVAEAVAASAAVPYAIGALKFALPTTGWYDTDPASRAPRAPKAPPFSVVNLWDGGAYENLGLEPLYKDTRGAIDCDFLICSDASGPLKLAKSHPIADLLKGRLSSPRLFDIASDQIRSLRSRMIMSAIGNGQVRGVLFRMGNSMRNLDIKTGTTRTPAQYDDFLSDAEVTQTASYPTDLNSLSPAAFDQIARHGYEIAENTLTAYEPQFPD